MYNIRSHATRSCRRLIRAVLLTIAIFWLT